MSNEGIRLPSDRTVASQKVHRGSTLPDAQLSKAAPKETPPNQTLLTVVLQAKPLIEGKKGNLFELVLQNDPKSAPPIRLQTDTRISPGTSLILEQVAPNQFEALKNPSKEQLTKLVQLELEFWRAHLLPKAGRRVFPALPSLPELNTLVKDQPALKPLVQWLTQQPASLSAQTVKQWIREFSPLSPMRNWITPAPSPQNAILPTSTPTQPAEGSKVQPSYPLGASASLPTTTATTTLSTFTLTTPDLRLTFPVGLTPSSALRPASLFTALSALSSNLSQTPLNPTRSDPPLRFEGQVFKSAESLLNPQSIREVLSPVRPEAFVRTMNSGANLESSIQARPNQPTTVNSTLGSATQGNTSNAGNLPTSPTIVPVSSQPTQALPKTAPQDTVLPTAPTKAFVAPPSIDSALSANRAVRSDVHSEGTTPQLQPATHAPLPQAPRIDSSRPAILGRVPVEVLLTQWQRLLEGVVAQSPAAVKTDIQNKAADLLQQMSQQSQIINSGKGFEQLPSKDQSNDEPPALQLRNWLDATVARIQNNAIQIAAAQWASPEPPVQQMQLPLIWLGLTHWADIEWYQEKARDKKTNKKEDEKQQRRWRMKIFLTLAPMAPMCADIDWSDQQTQVTFWSEDAATLQHMNSLMPTLHEWTEGLGEKQLTTKHGMPKRADQKNQLDDSQHLVDIRT